MYTVPRPYDGRLLVVLLGDSRDVPDVDLGLEWMCSSFKLKVFWGFTLACLQ